MVESFKSLQLVALKMSVLKSGLKAVESNFDEQLNCDLRYSLITQGELSPVSEDGCPSLRSPKV